MRIKSCELRDEAVHKRSAFFSEPDFSLERFYLKKGFRHIAGIDEAGRGALAGPLAVGLVIFNEEVINGALSDFTRGIRDSKKISPCGREKMAGKIAALAGGHHVELVSSEIIDSLNVNGATKFAIDALISRCKPLPDLILLDGNFNFEFEIPCVNVVKGDNTSISIAAASIMAKVHRDNVMVNFDSVYQGYGFSRNKGYGTADHLNAIADIGHCPIHRLSYEPVKTMIGGAGT